MLLASWMAMATAWGGPWPGLCPDGFLLEGRDRCVRWTALPDLPQVDTVATGPAGTFAAGSGRVWRLGTAGDWLPEPVEVSAGARLVAVGAVVVAVAGTAAGGDVWVRRPDGWTSGAPLPEGGRPGGRPVRADGTLVTESGWRYDVARDRWRRPRKRVPRPPNPRLPTGPEVVGPPGQPGAVVEVAQDEDVVVLYTGGVWVREVVRTTPLPERLPPTEAEWQRLEAQTRP